MRITDIKYEKLQVKLKKPFVIAFATIEYAETILIKIETDEGYYGFGEAAPFAPVTGEILETVPMILDMFKQSLVGMNPLDIEMIHTIMDKMIVKNTAAKAGIDIALHDLKGRVMNQPLYKILGGYDNKVQTDITIGIDTPVVMAKDALEKVNSGFRILKIKAGIDPKDDIEAVRLIREAVGNNVRLRMDANQGWNVNSSINTLKELEKYNVEAVEQSLPYWNFDGSTQIRNKSNINVMLDESIHNPMDAIRAIKQEAADILNIKLMKSSGLYPAVKINAIAEANGIHCMVGCMLESKISITAGASLVAAKKNITEADLDATFHLEENESIKGGFTLDKDTIIISDKPGLGIEVNM